ncbi:MAG: hypothetical protein ACN6OD_02060 [Alcaligenes sp.]
MVRDPVSGRNARLSQVRIVPGLFLLKNEVWHKIPLLKNQQ